MSRTIEQIDAAIAALDERLETTKAEARALLAAGGVAIDDFDPADFDAMTAGQRAAADRYKVGLNRLLDERAALLTERTDARHERIRQLATDPKNVERAGEDLSTPKKGNRKVNHLDATQADYHRAAMAAIERHAVIHPAAADRLDRVIRAEPVPAHARYLAAVGADAYWTAWQALISSPDSAALELDTTERAALREARMARTQMNALLGTEDLEAGGTYPLPLQVDPTLILTGPGAEDPLRRLATVRTIVGRNLTVVTGAAVSASYGKEGTDVGEVLPDPTPVTIKAERGAAFLRLTFEVLQDLAGAVGEITRIFNEAKTMLEAEKFAIGSGVDEPEGIFVGAAVDDVTPTSPVGLRTAQNDLAPRYQGNARWLTNLLMINTIATFVASADPVEPQIFDAQGRLLRKPVEEVSFAPDEDVIYGDVRAGFTIVDRLGASIEPTGVHFNPVTGVPSGSRGFLLLFRSGSKVVNEDALVHLGEVS